MDYHFHRVARRAFPPAAAHLGVDEQGIPEKINGFVVISPLRKAGRPKRTALKDPARQKVRPRSPAAKIDIYKDAKRQIGLIYRKRQSGILRGKTVRKPPLSPLQK